MGKPLTEIAQQLKDANKSVQLIYAFNGTGKTRLSREFKQLISPKAESDDEADPTDLTCNKILYYNAFTEDLFYWDNDLQGDVEPKLKIQPNSFTDWVFKVQGQDRNIVTNFQRYTNDKLTPRFNEKYNSNGRDGKEVTINAFSEVTFSLERGDSEKTGYMKISKGEESFFIWSIFYSLIEEVVGVLDSVHPDYPEATLFDNLEYVFIDDPVSSLDDNHLIELAVNLAQLIKSNKSKIKFIITTHNPLFYNVLHNEFKSDKNKKYILKKYENNTFELIPQKNDSPFSYHLYLKAEIENAIRTGQLHKYHYNFLRNILEKMSTFLGYETWGDLLPPTGDGKPNAYLTRIVNISSHSKHAGDEVVDLTDDDKRVLGNLVNEINTMYRFQPTES